MTDHTLPQTSWQTGQELGVSDWIQIDQRRIDIFGEVTDDLEPLHNDPEWCRENSPFGATIAYGFLTLSLLTRLMHGVTGDTLAGSVEKVGFPLNYGFDRIRFIAPVPVGARIRGRFVLTEQLPHNAGDLLRFGVTVEIEGESRPAIIADWLSLWVADGTLSGAAPGLVPQA